jgi:arabinogalactan oligomer/maltooligosaccharide transport system permease protein
MTAASFTHVRTHASDALGKPAPRVGLLGGVLVLFLLIVWLAHGAARDISLAAGAREAQILAETAAADIATAPEAGLAARLTAVRDSLGLPSAQLRFADIAGKRLVASVGPGPETETARALTLAEKPLYDDALRLRAARLADPAAPGLRLSTTAEAVTAAVPVVRDGAVVGVLEARLPAKADAGPIAMAIAGGAALIVGLIGLPLIGRAGARATWLAPGIVLVAGLAAGLVLSAQLQTSAAVAAAEVEGVEAAAFAFAGGTAASATTAAGALITQFAAEAADAARASLWAGAALAALLSAFIAFGWAGKLLATVREHRTAYLYLAPAMIGMLVLSFFPFFYGFALSFTDTTLLNAGASYADR